MNLVPCNKTNQFQSAACENNEKNVMIVSYDLLQGQ